MVWYCYDWNFYREKTFWFSIFYISPKAPLLSPPLQEVDPRKNYLV